MTFSLSLLPESFTCRLVVPAQLRTLAGRNAPSMVPAPGPGMESVSQPSSKPKGCLGLRSAGTLQHILWVVCPTGLRVILFPGCRGSSPSSSQLLCTGESTLLCSARLCPVPRDVRVPLCPLSLQAGQYASVFVDNAAGSPLTVQSGSDFSAILLGV